jgi:protein involved in polysaccharide export with SLBB domain
VSARSVFGLRAEAEVRGVVRALVILGLLLPGNAGAASGAGYRVDVGDVIEVSIAGAPDLQLRLPIQLDGTISFPMLGTITVSGLSPLDVQARSKLASPPRSFGAEHRTDARTRSPSSPTTSPRPWWNTGRFT